MPTTERRTPDYCRCVTGVLCIRVECEQVGRPLWTQADVYCILYIHINVKITFVLVYVGLDFAMKCGTVRDGSNRRMCPGCAWGMDRERRDGKGFFMSSPHGKA